METFSFSLAQAPTIISGPAAEKGGRKLVYSSILPCFSLPLSHHFDASKFLFLPWLPNPGHPSWALPGTLLPVDFGALVWKYTSQQLCFPAAPLPSSSANIKPGREGPTSPSYRKLPSLEADLLENPLLVLTVSRGQHLSSFLHS